MTLYKPRAELQLDVPFWGEGRLVGDVAQNEHNVVWRPRVIELKWTKNHHYAADELTVTVSWMEGGADPRMMKHAHCRMWLWDAASETFDEEDHLRFVGICQKAQRRLSESGWVVDMTFHDYTSFFLAMKPYSSDGMPEWSDTLPEIWRKICDYTGARDLNGKIVSVVAPLKDAIVFDPPELAQRTLGETVPQRFHKISKPTPKSRTDAWAVWQYCVASLGLVSFIDRGEVIVRKTREHFTEENGPVLLYGQNILDFEETMDTHIALKGILGKSFDHLRGVVLESAWPPPGDPLIKKTRAVVKRASKEGRDISINETSAEYVEQNFHDIQDQATLDARVRETFEEWTRQEMRGKIRTREMKLYTRDKGAPVDILELNAGDCIHVGMDEGARDTLKFLDDESRRIQHIMDTQGVIYPVARLIAKNIAQRIFASPIFHVETLEVELTPDAFNIDITYHNKVNLSGVYE